MKRRFQEPDNTEKIAGAVQQSELLLIYGLIYLQRYHAVASGYMKHYKRITFGLILMEIVLFIVVVAFFQVDDMTLGRGDEYVAFLPEITREELTGLMDQLMERIKQDVVLPDAGNTMGISIGAAFFNSDDHEYRDLFHCADNALYAAKKMGKNRYHVYEE